MKKIAKVAKLFKGRSGFAGSRGWIAMGTLAAYAVVGGTKSGLTGRIRGGPHATTLTLLTALVP